MIDGSSGIVFRFQGGTLALPSRDPKLTGASGVPPEKLCKLLISSYFWDAEFRYCSGLSLSRCGR